LTLAEKSAPAVDMIGTIDPGAHMSDEPTITDRVKWTNRRGSHLSVALS